MIDRNFGVLEARFPILKRIPFPVQRSIVVAAMVMHDFIIIEAMENQLFSQFLNENV